MATTWIRTVNRYGAVTIPAPLRRLFHLRPGSRVVLVAMKDHFRIAPLHLWRKHKKADRSR